MTDPALIVIVVATFLLAGLVKGVIGMGLPTVALGVLAVATDLSIAMALMIAPSLVTNLMQAITGGHLRAILRDHWLFLLSALACIWVGGLALNRVDLGLLSGVLGLSLVIYAAAGLLGVRLAISPRPLAALPFGALNGVLTGMTGSFIVPSVMYLQASGLGRDALVQAMGVVFLASTVMLAIVLRQNTFLTDELGITSLAAILPAVAGMYLGQLVRHQLSETMFRRIFLLSTLALGGYLTVRAGLLTLA
ncbi:MAG: sulfite exporter TauE/SafE family protein [Pseudomonadota bacterium]